MNQIINIDIENMQATAQCGVPLEVLENALREKGYTTGHSPQSKPLAQMGGLVATRSIGQFSTLYGAIEDMVVGLEAVLADGTVTRIKNVPRRAAGPDIRHIIIGNEGALCYITEVTVKIFKFTPENNLFYGYILEDMKPASTSCVKSWWKGIVRRSLVCMTLKMAPNTSPILPTVNVC